MLYLEAVSHKPQGDTKLTLPRTMGTSSEDVLLMVGNVRYKKNNGTLYLMSERIAWMLEGKDTFPVSHKYSDIKSE